MTRHDMTGQEYLGELKRIEMSLMQKQRELKALAERRVLIRGQDYNIEKVQTSPPNGAGFTKDSDMRLDMERELANDLAVFESIRYEILNQIQSLSKADYIDVLYRRYMQGQDFKEIADIKRCSISTVYHIHADAIKELESKYQGVFSKVLQRFGTVQR